MKSTLLILACLILFGGTLLLIVLSLFSREAQAAGESSDPEVDQLEVFVSGQEGYHTFRIPALYVLPSGTILAFCEGRKDSRGDSGDIDLVLKRSFDGGKTWGPLQVVAEDGPNTMGNPCPVLDRETGILWLPMTHNLGKDRENKIKDRTSEGTRTVWITHSKDEGETWAKPVEITETTKKPEWTWYATGPGNGIQLESGRLLIPCDHAVEETQMFRSHVIYSDDHGETWKLGGVPGDDTNECAAVEVLDGLVLLNMRSYHGKNRRALSVSHDGGDTWSEVRLDAELVEPVCQASFIRYTKEPEHNKNRLLFSNPASTERVKMTIKMSYDEGDSWPVAKLLNEGPSAYSSLAVLPDLSIGCLYERGVESAYEKITFARFSLEWLTDGEDRRP